MKSTLLTFKSIVLIALFSVLSTSVACGQLGSFGNQASPQDPVTWKTSVKKVGPNTYDLVFKGTPEKHWHFYSQYTEGTMPMGFYIDTLKSAKTVGGLRELTPVKEEYDSLLNGLTKYWKSEATFKQKIKVLDEGAPRVVGVIEFQACIDGACTMLTLEFDFDLPAYTDEPEESATDAATANDTEEVAEDTLVQNEVTNPEETKTATPETEEAKASEEAPKEKEEKEKSGLWMIFFISFGLGMLALITPCVFPMIPMTVSFFMKGNKSKAAGRKQAIFFGLSIISIFTVLGLLLTLTLGEDAMYIISTHWIPNTIFFIIFMIFALSFFGLFEITLPSSLVNKSDAQADKGGYIGTFFIAFTTVLVSFSCTGPILGAALIGLTSGSGNSMVFLMSMLGFAVGFALPFSLLAYFPSVMGKMKSGAWLNTVKIVFGFIEIALGLKFLSMADLSANWGILDRETFLALWIVVFGMLGFYLLGKLRFKGDAKLEQIGVSRLFLAIITLSFVVYMIPGLWGAPLKVLSGYVPPLTTQDFDLPRDIVNNAGGGGGTTAHHKSDLPERKYTDELHMPTGFDGFFDLEEAKAYAKKVGKPIFVDFTGKTCANCREMEYNVWTDPEVKKMLNEEFVMVALYADANFIKLPEEEWIIEEGKRPIKTLGKKNLKYQRDRFKLSAQPYYVLMDAEENVLTLENAVHDKDVSIFANFLKEGIENYKTGKRY
jgi:thiol:disulfide interchange protein DsbD